MPAPGDQHKAWANPFEEGKKRISEWTAKDIATISARLDKQLGPEYISSRSGPGGGKVHYLTAEKCITLANEVFGFNGWSSSIQNIQVDFADENPQSQRVSIGLSVIVRVTLRDGTFHEDIGYGSIENAKGKAMAFEKAKKEGTTDGLKRALRSFGNVLGNCIYDKGYVSQVTKIKAQPVKKFDEDNLHRHSDFMKKEVVMKAPETLAGPAPGGAPSAADGALKPEPSESFEDFLGELDEADFCVPESDHPDEIILPTTAQAQGHPAQGQPQGQRETRSATPAANNGQPQTPGPGQRSGPQPNNGSSNRPQIGEQRNSFSNAGTNANGPAAAAQQPQNPPETVGFFSARAVPQLPESGMQGQSNAQLALPHGQHAFNPKLESPSIRKTPGIDHNSSKPVSRSGLHVPPASSQSSGAPGAPAPANPTTGSFTPVRPSGPGSQATRGNVVNPSLDHTRRIGAPNGPSSPLGNRGSYRPPTMKRPLPGEANPANGGTRPPLADVPANRPGNAGAAGGNATGLEAKRQKMT